MRSDVLAEQRDCCLRHCNCIWLRNTVSNENESYFVPIHVFSTNTIHNCMQFKLLNLLSYWFIEFTKWNDDVQNLHMKCNL